MSRCIITTKIAHVHVKTTLPPHITLIRDNNSFRSALDYMGHDGRYHTITVLFTVHENITGIITFDDKQISLPENPKNQLGDNCFESTWTNVMVTGIGLCDITLMVGE